MWGVHAPMCRISCKHNRAQHSMLLRWVSLVHMSERSVCSGSAQGALFKRCVASPCKRGHAVCGCRQQGGARTVGALVRALLRVRAAAGRAAAQALVAAAAHLHRAAAAGRVERRVLRTGSAQPYQECCRVLLALVTPQPHAVPRVLSWVQS